MSLLLLSAHYKISRGQVDFVTVGLKHLCDRWTNEPIHRWTGRPTNDYMLPSRVPLKKEKKRKKERKKERKREREKERKREREKERKRER